MTGERALLDSWSAALAGGWSERCRAVAALALASPPDRAAGAPWDDAQAAMLRLAAGADGVVRAVAACAGCTATIDVELPFAALAAAASATAPQRRGAARVPTVADMAEAAASGSVAAAEIMLAERCGVAGLAPAEQAAAMAALDRQHPLLVPTCALACPECGVEFDAALDAVELGWASVEAAAAALVDDVVALALAFGWSEHDVLAVAPARRAVYRRWSEAAMS